MYLTLPVRVPLGIGKISNTQRVLPGDHTVCHWYCDTPFCVENKAKLVLLVETQSGTRPSRCSAMVTNTKVHESTVINAPVERVSLFSPAIAEKEVFDGRVSGSFRGGF